MSYENISTEIILFLVLYGITGAVPLIAAIYLLLRRGNAFAFDVTPPMRLRRWASAFFATSVLSHVWWILFHFYSSEFKSVGYLMIVMLDCVLLSITFVGMLLAMLQDRKRPLWPAIVALIPFVALMVTLMLKPNKQIELITNIYLLSVCLLFTVYMGFAIRRYGRWLNDNYADLENKKVWLSQTVSLGCMLMYLLYILATNMVVIYLLHITIILLVGLLLWRIETLPTLQEQDVPKQKKYAISSNIEQLLAEHCVDTRLYLQHDLTLQQLAQALGTNRLYLSQYFSSKDQTYNAYINDLRIDHFVNLYRQTVADQRPFTVQQLASDSGYHSYSTFSLAFKQRMGQSVTVWMREG